MFLLACPAVFDTLSSSRVPAAGPSPSNREENAETERQADWPQGRAGLSAEDRREMSARYNLSRHREIRMSGRLQR